MTRKSLNSQAAWCLAAVILLCLGGCFGEKPVNSYTVTGKISYDGKPIPKGVITFAPDDKKGNEGLGTTAEIKDGTYQTQPDKGISGGPYILNVQGYDGVPIASGEGGMNHQGKPLFAPKDIEVNFPKENTTKDIEIPKGR